MADHGTPKYSTAAGNDYAEHESTYGLFIWLTKWTIIIVAAILVFMFLFLA
jgi:hypothetical protein